MSGDITEDAELRRARLAVTGVLMDLLDWSPWRANRLAKAAAPKQLTAIWRAGCWPIRNQAREAVERLAARAERDCRLPEAA